MLTFISFSEIDIYLGTLEESFITNKYTVPSKSYHKDSLTFCVQKKKQIPLRSIIFHLITDPEVAIILTLQSITIGIVAYFMQQFERQPKWDYLRLTVYYYMKFNIHYDLNLSLSSDKWNLFVFWFSMYLLTRK